jgi:hypothetical protein
LRIAEEKSRAEKPHHVRPRSDMTWENLVKELYDTAKILREPLVYQNV